MSEVKPPSVWAVVLGYNNSGDTIECLHSVFQSDLPGLRVLYVDNGSRPEERARVMAEAPGCDVLALEPNAGVSGGLNAGIRHAHAGGADHIILFNNDTKIAPDAVRRMSEEAALHPAAGMVVPKIFYYDHPTHIWAAGSHYRRFPPVVVQYTPEAHAWHKISRTTGAGTRKPAFWHSYGRSEAIFRRKFRHHHWLTGWTHALYIIARFVFEGNSYGVRPYIQGWRKGATDPIQPPPRVDDPRIARGNLIRQLQH